MTLSQILVLALLCYSVSSTPISKTTLTHKKTNTSSSKITNFYVTSPGIGRHKLHLNPRTWEEARVICLNEGAHLVVVKSAAEGSVLTKAMTEKEVTDVWIGVHEQFKKGDWITIQDQRLDAIGYVQWAENKPDNDNDDSKHCVTMVQEGGMSNLDCDTAKPFYCKIE